MFASSGSSLSSELAGSVKETSSVTIFSGLPAVSLPLMGVGLFSCSDFLRSSALSLIRFVLSVSSRECSGMLPCSLSFSLAVLSSFF